MKNILIILLFVCNYTNSQTTTLPTDPNLKIAYFASGCFWCVEAIYESVPGVKEVISGYAGGSVKNPTYNTLSHTNHAETVAVYYDPNLVSYNDLINVFYTSQNPTTYGQHPDFGKNYRSIIFYNNKEEQNIAWTNFKEINKLFNGKAITEIKKIKHFYTAEDYHQDYEKHHPENAYIKSVSIPRLNKFKALFFKK